MSDDAGNNSEELAAIRERNLAPHRFVKGDPRINRSGRPKSAGFRQECRDGSEAAMRRLIKLINDGKLDDDPAELREAMKDLGNYGGYCTVDKVAAAQVAFTRVSLEAAQLPGMDAEAQKRLLDETTEQARELFGETEEGE